MELDELCTLGMHDLLRNSSQEYLVDRLDELRAVTGNHVAFRTEPVQLLGCLAFAAFVSILPVLSSCILAR